MQERVYLAVIPYRAEMRRHGQLVALDIPTLSIPKCENCGELLFTDRVDQQIRHAFDAAEAPRLEPGCNKTPDGNSFPSALTD